jgi:hypothetical protein
MVIVAGALGMAFLWSPDPASAASPIDIVAELYDDFPYSADPPGGQAIWTEGIRLHWQSLVGPLAKAEAKGSETADDVLGFNFMNASQADFLDSLKIKTLFETEGSGEVKVSLDNGESARIVLFYEFVQEGEWKIHDVVRQGDEGWRLSRLLKQTLIEAAESE